MPKKLSNQYTYIGERRTVKVNIPEIGMYEEIPWLQFYARIFVMNHMAHSGGMRYIVPDKVWHEAYLLCDGFGKISEALAAANCYDWSHVRDCSFPTLVTVAEFLIKSCGYIEPISVIADKFLVDVLDHGYDPVKFVGWRKPQLLK